MACDLSRDRRQRQRQIRIRGEPCDGLRLPCALLCGNHDRVWGRGKGEGPPPPGTAQGKGIHHSGMPGRCGYGPVRYQEQAILLLECVSNLAANEMFADGGEGQGNVSIDKLADKLVKDILCLASQVKDMVIVTNEVASDGIIYDSGTAGYIRLMGLVNSRLGACSHRVVEVVYGIPVVWKG